VRRFYTEIDKGNIEIIDELVGKNYIDHNPPPFPLPPGREGSPGVAFWNMRNASFTPCDYAITLCNLVFDGVTSPPMGNMRVIFPVHPALVTR